MTEAEIRKRTPDDTRSGAPAAAKRQRGRPPIESGAQREKILRAASRLFIENGFASTTLDAVGEAAGVTKRTIYQHIGNKDALFRTVLHQRLPLADEMRFEIDIDGKSVEAVVTAMARRLLETALAPEAIALQRTIVIEAMRFPQLVQDVIDDGMATLNGNIATIFAELVQRGALPPTDTARAADLFYDIVIGNRSFRLTMGHREIMPDEEELRQRVHMFLYGHLLPHAG